MTKPLDRITLRACADHATEIFPRVAGRLARPGQLAAYLAIVELELPASGVRRWLDWSRAEIDTACLDVEDLRENPALDEAITAAGAALRADRGGSAPLERDTPAVADQNAQRAARAARRALQLLLDAGGQVVGHEAFGTVQTARTAICAARKKVGPDGIRTIRGRGFRITEAGMRAAQTM